MEVRQRQTHSQYQDAVPQNQHVDPNQAQAQMTEEQFLQLLRARNSEVPDPSIGITLPVSVTKLVSPITGAKIFLVGTAHVSRQSSLDVRTAIRALKPQQVVLELCPSRRVMIDPPLIELRNRFEEAVRNGGVPQEIVARLRDEEDEKDRQFIEAAVKKEQQKQAEKDAKANGASPASSTSSSPSASPSSSSNGEQQQTSNRFWDWLKDSYSVIRHNTPGGWFAILLTGLYKRVETQLDIESGVEMRAGAVEAALVNAKIMLGDRPIKITLSRTWGAMSLWQKLHFAGSLVIAAFSSISAEDVESLKQEDLLESVIKELSEKYPSLAKHVVEERDQFLAHTLRISPGPVVVGVVGAAHVPGIKANWEKQIDIKSLLLEPVPSVAYSLTKLLMKWSLLLLLPAALIYFVWLR